MLLTEHLMFIIYGVHKVSQVIQLSVLSLLWYKYIQPEVQCNFTDVIQKTKAESLIRICQMISNILVSPAIADKKTWLHVIERLENS